jgi:type IV pilus assembly protein PilF
MKTFFSYFRFILLINTVFILVACASSSSDYSSLCNNAEDKAGCLLNQAHQGKEIATVSDQTPNQRRAAVRVQLASGYYQQGQYATALDEIKQALLIDASYPDAYGVRALIYMEMKELGLAEENFLRAFKLAPNNPDVLNNYGWFLCQTGREKQSISLFEEATRNYFYQSPDKALGNAGACSWKIGNFEASERYLVMALKKNPNNVMAHLYLAKLAYGKKQYELAKEYVTYLFSIEESSPEIIWLGLNIARRLGDASLENTLATQLRRRYPGSNEYNALLRNAYDE